MKRNLQFIYLIAFVVLFSSATYGQTDSIIMGPGYGDDVFYSFKNGEVSKAARNTWDIAFFTPRFSAGIIINEGNVNMLYTYPNGDTSNWDNIDTSGMANWPAMFNSPEYWEDGAFNAHAHGHPDYGWGVYNMIDHSVYGDSLFIIKTPSGLKKLWIEKKISIENIYLFTYADLDGGNEFNVEFDVKPFETKQFAYYSLETNEGLDREPEKESWDIMFTKYMDWTTTNEGDSSRYNVTGITNNVNVFSKNFYPVEPSFNDWFPAPFDSTKNAIGYDWKSFDMGLFEWTLKDSNYYFVSTVDSNIYKLGFTFWSGSGSGVCHFEKTLVSLSGIDENESQIGEFDIFPNPARSFFTVKSSSTINEDCRLIIMDQTGKTVYERNCSAIELTNGIRISDLNISKGLYLLSIKNNQYASTQKLIVN